MCQYCQKKPATQGDHIIPLKGYAERVNRGEMTLEEARLTGNGASNVIGSCGVIVTGKQIGRAHV